MRKKVLEAIEKYSVSGGISASVLAEKLGAEMRNVRKIIKDLHDEGKIFIAGWYKPSHGARAPFYRIKKHESEACAEEPTILTSLRDCGEQTAKQIAKWLGYSAEGLERSLRKAVEEGDVQIISGGMFDRVPMSRMMFSLTFNGRRKVRPEGSPSARLVSHPSEQDYETKLAQMFQRQMDSEISEEDREWFGLNEPARRMPQAEPAQSTQIERKIRDAGQVCVNTPNVMSFICRALESTDLPHQGSKGKGLKAQKRTTGPRMAKYS